MKKNLVNNLLIVLFLIICSTLLINYTPKTQAVMAIDKTEIKNQISSIYKERSSVFVNNDLKKLENLFDTSQKFGKWGLEHEIKRVKYLRDWASLRNMEFTNVDSLVRIKKIFPKHNRIRIALSESYKFDYIYKSDENPITNTFGVGIRHTVDLIKKNEKWLIYSDWYTDCFEDALSKYDTSLKSSNTINKVLDLPIIETPSSPTPSKRYNREKAVAYADKYCGDAYGSTNNFKYNRKFHDFNGIGGDCTNFVSQVLSEGGGLKYDGSWHCHKGEGSRAFVNADGLKDYILYSGKGRLIRRGKFLDLIKKTEKFPNGAISKLELGDLVCYAKKSNIDHFAVVTGFDSHGYPLINSHTTDRYHVPWDLGWGDKDINFYLIHVR